MADVRRPSSSDSPRSGIGRRQVIQNAAWTIPAVVLTTSVPVATASAGCSPSTMTLSATPTSASIDLDTLTGADVTVLLSGGGPGAMIGISTPAGLYIEGLGASPTNVPLTSGSASTTINWDGVSGDGTGVVTYYLMDCPSVRVDVPVTVVTTSACGSVSIPLEAAGPSCGVLTATSTPYYESGVLAGVEATVTLTGGAPGASLGMYSLADGVHDVWNYGFGFPVACFANEQLSGNTMDLLLAAGGSSAPASGSGVAVVYLTACPEVRVVIPVSWG